MLAQLGNILGNMFRGGISSLPLQEASALRSSLALSAGVIFGINGAGFLYTLATRAHTLTDACGVGAFAASAITTYAFHRSTFAGVAAASPQAIILTSAVAVWAARLGTYLFRRILKRGEDERLKSFFPHHDDTKWTPKQVVKLSIFWMLQGTWGFVTMLPITYVHGLSPLRYPTGATSLSSLGGITGLVTLLGLGGALAFEAIADAQKSAFRDNPANADKFCAVGLWRHCRYPNYFGEIATWWLMYALAAPVLLPQNLVVPVMSPVFVSGLLIFLSGIPPSDKLQDKRFAKDPRYAEYKARVPTLIPSLTPQWPPESSSS